MIPLHLLGGTQILGPAILVLSTVFGSGASQPALEAEAARFAAAWQSGDVEALGRSMRDEGIRLHLQG